MLHPPRRAILGGFLTTVAATRLSAAEWPERPVVWVLPFPPGGPTDAFARPLGAQLASQLGRPMIMDSRSGAGGTLAAAAVARAAPDGYTLLVGYTGHTYAPAIYPKAGFDFARDFEPVSAFGRVAQVLVANPARFDGATLATFLERARARPGAIDIASAGLGTVPHLAVELLQARAGIKLSHVPYRGSAPAMQDLLAGTVDALFAPISGVVSQVRAGRLRALAIAARRRDPQLPDTPTFHESGLADFRVSSWYGLFAPKRTPAPVLDRLHGALQTALARDDIRQMWAAQGARVELESRVDFARFIGLEVERWNRIARAANVQLE
ncbi:MAG: twin-arginine translocation pathway signal protein [Enhydrobacter sp.]|nr:MAG: twin-arginine translocation pathway signal protein [Enhydrobacter sp.]